MPFPRNVGWHSVCAVASKKEPSTDELKQALMKLHKNLGHPPNADLIRVLRFGQASSEALPLAKEFSCPFCESRVKPKVPMPAKVDRVVGFNKQIGTVLMSNTSLVGSQTSELKR